MFDYILPVVAFGSVVGIVAVCIRHKLEIENLDIKHRQEKIRTFMEGWQHGYNMAKDDYFLKVDHYEEVKRDMEEGRL